MASPITTTSQIAGPVNVVFQVTLLKNAHARCPYYVGTTPAAIEFNRGSFTAKWRRIENLTPVTAALSELTGNVAFPTRNAVQPSVTDVTKAVAKYGNYILLNEETDLVNFNGQADKLMEVLGINAGQSLNRIQRNEVEDNSTLVQSSGAANDPATTTALQLNDIRNVVNVLDRNSGTTFTAAALGDTKFNTAPVRASYWGICHSDVEWDIRGMAGFVDVVSYGGQTYTAPGEFGFAGGARWISTPEASIDADIGGGNSALRGTTDPATNIDLYTSVVFGMNAVGSLGFGREHVKEIYSAGDKLPAVITIKKDFGSSGVADPFDELSSLGWKSWAGGKILNSDWIRGIRSGATALS
jgi:N4-gp56 family major capsid protein